MASPKSPCPSTPSPMPEQGTRMPVNPRTPVKEPPWDNVADRRRKPTSRKACHHRWHRKRSHTEHSLLSLQRRNGCQSRMSQTNARGPVQVSGQAAPSRLSFVFVDKTLVYRNETKTVSWLGNWSLKHSTCFSSARLRYPIPISPDG